MGAVSSMGILKNEDENESTSITYSLDHKFSTDIVHSFSHEMKMPSHNFTDMDIKKSDMQKDEDLPRMAQTTAGFYCGEEVDNLYSAIGRIPQDLVTTNVSNEMEEFRKIRETLGAPSSRAEVKLLIDWLDAMLGELANATSSSPDDL